MSLSHLCGSSEPQSMAKKPSAASDLEVAAVAAANRTVFIDTSLDTHFAMVLSDPDTVSDLKRKIENEHTLCFTNVGNIVVHALKVKRKGHLYHLSDSMFVKDAFDGANKNWFLSVDATVVEKKNDENQLVHNPDSHNLLTCYGILHDTSAIGVHLPLSAAKGKRKLEDKVGNQHLREENIDTGKDIFHPLTNDSITRRPKRRRKSKSKLDQVGAADPSSGRVITTGEELDTISVPRLDENGVKHYNIMLNTGEHVLSSEDEYDSDAPEGEATPTATQLRNSKDHYPVEVEGNHPVVTESHDDQPTDIRVSGQDNIGNDQAERAEKQGALSKREEYLETQSKKHDDLLLDIGVSGQKIIGSSPAGRAEEQGALSKNNGSFKTLLKKHDNQPLSTGVSGQGNTGTGQAERAEEQGALSKRTGSAKVQAKKHDDLPLDSGVSGKENERAEEQGALLRTGSAKMQAKKLDDLPVDSGVSGKENERAEEQEALSKRTGSAKMQAKKHDDLPLDSGVSGTENERAEEQGALSKRMGSAKMQAKKHDDLPLASGVSGKENERAEEQGALSKRRGSAKMQAKKHDDLPLDSGVSGKENERAEEQGALSKRTGSGKMQAKKHDDLPWDSGVSGKENERAEEQGALSKRMGSGKMQEKKHDDLPLDSGASGKENIGSGQAGRAEEQGSLSKKKDSLKTQSKYSDNIPTDIGVSGQENVGSDQTDRADEPGALSKKKDSFKMESKKHNDIPNEIAFPGKENIESGRAEKAEEQGALSKRKDYLDTQLKRLNATADLVGENRTVEPADSGKKRKRTRKPKDLVSKVVTASDREHVGGSEINISAEPLGAKHDELASNRARNEASISSQPNGKEELRSNAESTIRDKENDSISGNTVKNMQQTSKNQENAENVEEQVRKRSKKKQKSSAKNIPDLPSEYRSVVHQISQPPADNKCQVVTSSDTESKGKLKKTAAKDHLNEGKMESENLGVQKELVPAQSNSVLAKSTKVQSNSLDHKNEGNAGEADLIDIDNPPASADKANKEKEISGEKSFTDIVTSRGVLVDKKVGANKAAKTPKAKKNIEKPDIQSDRVSIDIQSSVKSNKKQGIEGKSPAGKSSTTPLQGSSLSKDKPDQSAVTKKNIEKPDIQSDQVSSDSQRSVKSNKKQGIERKPPAGKSSATPLQGSPLSKDKPDQSAVQPKKNLQKSSRNKAKAPPSDVSDKLNSTPKKAKTQNAVCVSGTNIHSEAKSPPSDISDKLSPTPKETKTQNAVSVSGANTHSGKTAGLANVSNSHMESSRKTISKDVAANKHQPGVDSYRASNAKTASKSDGKIVDREPGKKSIATPGKVFKDEDSVETSEDEEVDDSDASSKTPSDLLQSSDYSDGESNANFNSPCKGSNTSDRTKSGGRSTKKSCSGAKNMTFDSILKSSSRYKKAKLTASQLQLEDESQPDDFVPDSLPIE